MQNTTDNANDVFAFRSLRLFSFAALLMISLLSTISLADEIQFEQGGVEYTKQGRVLVEAQDGGVLFMANDGKLWLVQGSELKKREDNESTRKLLDSKKLGEEILKEMPDGFKIYTTKHFVICYNTSRDYAKWVGSVYERLYRGFNAHWTRKRRWKIEDAEGPLPVLLFRSKPEYTRYLKKELGDDAGETIAYYNLLTNRVAMYDLTGIESPSDVQIKRFVSNRSAHNMIATVVHEGTHQLIFNTGIQTRLADSPLWVNEGMAMYFETPDLTNNNGWKKIGVLNKPRLLQFRRNMSAGKVYEIEDVIRSDQVFRDGATASDAYAQAWALNYYLFNKHSKKYVEYLQLLSEKKTLVEVTPEERLRDFKSVFGDDTAKLQQDFFTYIRRIR